MSDRRRILDSELYAHFVTFSCFRRRKALDEDRPKRIVLGTLNAQLRRQDATCCGFVIMPEHVHIVVWFPQPKQLSRFMHDWKRESSRAIKAWFRASRPRYYAVSQMAAHFWQPKYYPFEIYTQTKLHEKVDYMHKNPVERQLVLRAVDYPWSSARYWLEGRSVGVPLGWIE
ncbi:MAG: transposase [Planctomycetaceae bacterium]|nr:transposase [Planctomycetaceae bacterium]